MTDLEKIKKILLDQGKKEYDDFDIIKYTDQIILTIYRKVLVAIYTYDTIDIDFHFDITGNLIAID